MTKYLVIHLTGDYTMTERFIRLPEVMSMTGLGKSTVWAWTKSGVLPKSYTLSKRCTVWKFSEIQAYLKGTGAVA